MKILIELHNGGNNVRIVDEVYEIVEETLTLRVWDDGSSETMSVKADDDFNVRIVDEVYEIVEETLTLRVWDDGSSETMSVEADDDFDEIAHDYMENGDWGDGDYRVEYSWQVTNQDDDVIAEGSGEVTGETAEPECEVSESGHEWTSEFEGGCRENPDVWSTGGTSHVFRSRCKCCGMERVEKTTGSQRNPGECDTTTYSEPDAEWVEKYIGETVDA